MLNRFVLSAEPWLQAFDLPGSSRRQAGRHIDQALVGAPAVNAFPAQQFHAEGEMSPAGFSVSVHNAAPGAFSLLTGNHAPYTAIAARERSLEAGLLETLALGKSAVFVFAEEATPKFYAPEFGPLQCACALAAHLEPDDGGVCSAEFRTVERPPISFDGAVEFFEGRRDELSAASFGLVRR